MPVIDTTGWASFNTNTGGSGDITLSALVVDTEPSEPIRALYYMEALGGLLWEYGTCALLDNELTEREVISSSSGRARVIFPKSGVTVKLAPPVEEIVLGGGITNGDKGDVTVAGGGASLTLNTGAVDVAHLSTDFSAAMKALLAGTGTAADNATALGLGTAALEATTAFAADGHSHAIRDLDEVLLDGGTEDQVLSLDSLGRVVPRTIDLEAISTAGLAGSATEKFVVWDPTLNAGAGGWYVATPDQVLALVGAHTACPIPGDITANGDYMVCPYSPIAGTITAVVLKTLGGSGTFDFKIGATSVTGVSAIPATTTKSNTAATAANVLARGDEINLTVTAASSLTGVVGVLLVERLAP